MTISQVSRNKFSRKYGEFFTTIENQCSRVNRTTTNARSSWSLVAWPATQKQTPTQPRSVEWSGHELSSIYPARLPASSRSSTPVAGRAGAARHGCGLAEAGALGARPVSRIEAEVGLHHAHDDARPAAQKRHTEPPQRAPGVFLFAAHLPRTA